MQKRSYKPKWMQAKTILTFSALVNCLEAEKYKDKVWIVRSNPWILGCGEEVVLLEGKSGGFSAECLKKVRE